MTKLRKYGPLKDYIEEAKSRMKNSELGIEYVVTLLRPSRGSPHYHICDVNSAMLNGLEIIWRKEKEKIKE